MFLDLEKIMRKNNAYKYKNLTDECPCNTCARDNYSRTRTTSCCEKHKRERSEEGELIPCREWTKCPDYIKENTDESI